MAMIVFGLVALVTGCERRVEAGLGSVEQEVGDLGHGVYPLEGTDPTLPTTDLRPLKKIVGDADLVGIGVPWHTTGGLYQMSDRIFRYLVEEKGFRALGIENPWIYADALQSYLETCQGSIDDLIVTSDYRQLFSIWRATEIRDSLQFICQWNQSHPQDRVHFFGFDINGQMALNGQALFAFLAELGISSSDPRFADIAVCDGVGTVYFPSPYPQAAYDRCQGALSQLEAFFDDNEASILQQTSSTALGYARLHLANQQDQQENRFYTFAFPYGTPEWTQGFAARERGMARTILALRDLRFPGAKAVLWSVNGHILYNSGDALNGLDAMGNRLRAALGTDYKVILTTASTVEIDWGLAGQCGILAPDDPVLGNTEIEDSIEPVLQGLGAGPVLVRMRRDKPHPAFLDVPHSLFDFWPTLLSDSSDALVYLDESPAMHPIGPERCAP